MHTDGWILPRGPVKRPQGRRAEYSHMGWAGAEKLYLQGWYPYYSLSIMILDDFYRIVPYPPRTHAILHRKQPPFLPGLRAHTAHTMLPSLHRDWARSTLTPTPGVHGLRHTSLVARDDLRDLSVLEICRQSGESIGMVPRSQQNEDFGILDLQVDANDVARRNLPSCWSSLRQSAYLRVCEIGNLVRREARTFRRTKDQHNSALAARRCLRSPLRASIFSFFITLS